MDMTDYLGKKVDMRLADGKEYPGYIVDETDGFSFGIKYTAELSGMEFESYTVLDRRNQNDAAKSPRDLRISVSFGQYSLL